MTNHINPNHKCYIDMWWGGEAGLPGAQTVGWFKRLCAGSYATSWARPAEPVLVPVMPEPTGCHWPGEVVGMSAAAPNSFDTWCVQRWDNAGRGGASTMSTEMCQVCATSRTMFAN